MKAKSIISAAFLTITAATMAFAQGSAPAQSGYYNRDRYVHPDSGDVEHPKGFDTREDGTRVLRRDSAENANKINRGQAKEMRESKNNGKASSKRSQASGKTKD